MSLYVSRKRRTDINVVPLIDVMTVLLVFLLITTRFDDTESLAITPPSAETAGKSDAPDTTTVVLAVDKSGRLFVNANPVTRPDLDTALTQAAKRAGTTTALVVADESAPTKDTVYALDRARHAGLSPRLVTRPAP